MGRQARAPRLLPTRHGRPGWGTGQCHSPLGNSSWGVSFLIAPTLTWGTADLLKYCFISFFHSFTAFVDVVVSDFPLFPGTLKEGEWLWCLGTQSFDSV